MLVYMSSNSSRHSLDFKRAEKEQQRGFKMPLWRLTLLTFVSTGSLWAAQHALSRLRMMGQDTSDILWGAFVFAAVFTLLMIVTNVLTKREDAKRKNTLVDSHQ